MAKKIEEVGRIGESGTKSYYETRKRESDDDKETLHRIVTVLGDPVHTDNYITARDFQGITDALYNIHDELRAIRTHMNEITGFEDD